MAIATGAHVKAVVGQAPETEVATSIRKLILISTLVWSASTALAGASAAPSHETRSPSRTAIEGLQLAQTGDVDIYYDERGRQIIVDAETGEVLAIRPARRVERQQQRRAERRRMREEQVYEEQPDDLSRLLGTVERLLAPPVRRYEELPPQGYPEEAYPEEDYAFPDAPQQRRLPPPIAEQDEPRVVTREPDKKASPKQVERKSLGEVAAAEPEDGNPAKPDPSKTGTVVVPGTATAEPDYSNATPEIIEEKVAPSITFGGREEVAALQVLLDRGGASPGVIDGKFGSNVDKAIIAYRQITGKNLKSTDTALIKQLLAETGGDPLVNYTITPADAAGPYVASVPEDYGQKAKLDRLAFTSVTEGLAERFHMDETYLKALNPGANFNRPGTIIKVANVGQLVTTKVQRIVADKANKQVRAFDANNKLVAVYPSTIGSSDTPSPSGVHAVSRIAFDPEYTYNPNLNFKQGDNDKILTIPPGPNNPVGTIWIALDKPTYGIHGTPEPSKIGKTESHGCVRLTNWDAAELAKLVSPGVTVEFTE